LGSGGGFLIARKVNTPLIRIVPGGILKQVMGLASAEKKFRGKR